MKKIFLSFIALILSVSVFAQAVVHTVQRGETLESIAQKYGVSTQDLLNANPDAKEYLYTGMKITIPAVQKAVVNYEERSAATKATTSTSTASSSSSYSSTNYSAKEGGLYAMAGRKGFVGNTMISYLLPPNEHIENFNIGLALDLFGYCYYVHNNVYIEGTLGFGWNMYRIKREKVLGNISTDGGSLSWWGINVPLHVGGLFPISEKSAFSVFAGPRIQFAVTGEQKTGSGKDEKKIKYKDLAGYTPVTAYIELGVEFQYKDVGYAIVYDLGMGDFHKKENNVSLCFRYRLY